MIDAAGRDGLRVDDIAVRRGDVLRLDGVSFTAARGAVTAMLGPNGAGKTTTFSAIVSQVDLERGSITFDGEAIRSVHLGYAPQAGSLYPYLSGLDNARAFCAFARMRRKDRDRAAREIIQIASLDGREDDRLATYSGGMRQRLSLAIAAVGDPDLLLLDEPTVGVDPQARLHLLDWIRQIARERDAAIVYSSHYLDEIEYLCDRVVVIDEGKTITEGTLEELTASTVSRLSMLVTITEDQLLRLRAVVGDGDVGYDPTSRRLIVETAAGQSPARAVLELLESEALNWSDLTISQPKLDERFLALTGADLRD